MSLEKNVLPVSSAFFYAVVWFVELTEVFFIKIILKVVILFHGFIGFFGRRGR